MAEATRPKMKTTKTGARYSNYAARPKIIDKPVAKPRVKVKRARNLYGVMLTTANGAPIMWTDTVMRAIQAWALSRHRRNLPSDLNANELANERRKLESDGWRIRRCVIEVEYDDGE